MTPRRAGASGGNARQRLRKFWDHLAQGVDLPQDLVLDIPRVTMVGKLQLTVENHRGLLLYSPHEVWVSVTRGLLKIRGDDLSIGVVHQEELTVVGLLRSVEFVG